MSDTDPGYYARYDYAWKTPGWSAQNPVINYGTDGYVNPGLPSDVSLVRVYGQFLEMDTGRGLEGVLRIRTKTELTHGPTGMILPPGLIHLIRFEAAGFSLYLPATDDLQLTPPFRYYATLTVRGVKHEFDFTLPAATPEVNVQTLISASQPVSAPSHLAQDTDTTPYFDEPGSQADLFVRFDTDGTAYFSNTAPNLGHLAADTDGTPYTVNGTGQ